MQEHKKCTVWKSAEVSSSSFFFSSSPKAVGPTGVCFLDLNSKAEHKSKNENLQWAKISIGSKRHMMDLWEGWRCPCSAPMCFYCSAFIYSPCNLRSGRRKGLSGTRSGKQLTKKWRRQQVSITVSIHFPPNSALPVPVGKLCACTLHMACTR